jgi:hypothetical protein
MKKVLLALLTVTTLFAASCTKSGPQGPQGPAGAQGPAGNANVIGSDHITVSEWTYLSASATYTATFNYNDITDNVANFGLVAIYKQYQDGSWTNLPDLNGLTTTVFNFSAGTFTLYIFNSDGSVPTAPPPTTFRVVVIPSGLKQANPKTNWNDYNETIQTIEHSGMTVKQLH